MSSSKCKQCGEKIVETGNYSFKILPAKRIPKKARKLMKNSEDSKGKQQQSSTWGMTKFRKFLEERSKPANFLELTCGKCGGISKIKYPSLSFSSSSRQEVTRTSIDQKNQNSYRGGGRGGRRPAVPNAQREAKRKADLENLNKILFQSKKAKKSGSTLEDFLSSI